MMKTYKTETSDENTFHVLVAENDVRAMYIAMKLCQRDGVTLFNRDEPDDDYNVIRNVY